MASNNPEHRKEYLKKWIRENPEKIKLHEKKRCKKDWKKRNDALIEKRQEQRLKLLVLLGDKCNRCGFADKRALQIDHINGDGALEKKKFNNPLSSRFFLNQSEESIEKFLSKYQILCANCNWIKRSENNEF